MKRIVVLAIVCLAAVSAFGQEIRLAHVVNERDSFHLTAEKFKELAERYTNGAVRITIFPNATLGDERTLLERMRMGIVDAGIITSGPIINFVPRFGVIDLPFLFRSPEHAYRVLDGAIGDSLFQEMENQGWKGLAWAERGFRNLTNNVRQVRTPRDMEGLKIRVMQNPVYVDTFKAMGANAVPMAWTEALTALQQRTIDGQENPLNVIVAFKLDESQRFLSITRHAYAPAPILMSMMTWRRLSAANQAAVQRAAREAAQFGRELNNSSEAQWLRDLAARGMVIDQPDLRPFLDAVKPVYDAYSDRFGRDLIASIQAVR